jgi:hypothetical protein
MTKPDWKDAPEGMKWLAMDEDGSWYWFENKPSINRCMWANDTGYNELAALPVDWKDTLEPRP